MKRYFYLLAALMLMVLVACQKPVNVAMEEGAIKELIKLQNDSNLKGHFDGEAIAWAHEPYSVKMSGTETKYVSWDSISVLYKNRFSRMSKEQIEQDVTGIFSDYHIKIYKNTAWVVYNHKDEYSRQGNKTYGPELLEVRFLEKKNNQWKIVFQFTGLKSSQSSAESQVNSLGYSLLNGKQFREAIEVFKLNVKMYPQSSNTYDSLGEAYMANGETRLAIENYEKSLKLNPQNTNAVERLKELQRK